MLVSYLMALSKGVGRVEGCQRWYHFIHSVILWRMADIRQGAAL